MKFIENHLASIIVTLIGIVFSILILTYFSKADAIGIIISYVVFIWLQIVLYDFA